MTLTVEKFDPAALDSAHLMRLLTASNGLKISSRQYRFRHYSACFTGTELVDLLIVKLSITRGQAIRVGQRLLAQEHIRHVLDQHDFEDANLFYRIGVPNSKNDAVVLQLDREAARLAKVMRGPAGIRLKNHRRFLIEYRECFSGAEATDWLCEHGGLSRVDAVISGKAMVRNNLLRHVYDNKGFADSKAFYRFS